MSLYEKACTVLPGGVNSPVRAFRSVGGEPIFIRSAEGAWMEDEDGKRYVDYICGYGPLLFGHRSEPVEEALRQALARGWLFGAPTAAEVELGELICSAFPAMDMVRLVSSGTEATMSALRLARAATGRARVLKFEGCYHGHGDAFLVAAGSGAATIGVPSSPGVPKHVTDDTIVVPFNDLAACRDVVSRWGQDLAAVFVEPVVGNMGLVPPDDGFLHGLRELCSESGALLVFDEVMTGFRVAWGGAQTLFDIEPDLTTLGKVIGGGLPIGAYGGRGDLMEQIAPAGPVYQAGTLSGNPLAVAAGLAALQKLRSHRDEIYPLLEQTSEELARGIFDLASKFGIPVRIQRQGSMFGLFFTREKVRNLGDVEGSDLQRFSRFFHSMLRSGVHLPPSAFETWFLSTAHGEKEIEHTLQSVDRAFSHLSEL
jgi:glutamate-1-semialdehyde 2,1-aminomutase